MCQLQNSYKHCHQELIIVEESIQHSTGPLQMIQLDSKGFHHADMLACSHLQNKEM